MGAHDSGSRRLAVKFANLVRRFNAYSIEAHRRGLEVQLLIDQKCGFPVIALKIMREVKTNGR